MAGEAVLTRSGLELAAAIRSGELTSTEIVQAHIDRLNQVEPALNGIVRDRYEAALDEARAADERVAAARQSGTEAELPPLLGVPCTIKESFALAGMPNTAGVVHRRELIVEENATPVQRLIDAGAIPLGVTNISELTLWMESDNRVYGRANNAYDPRRTAGGSSGGEGAVIGAGGSPFGIGSDIAGSVRIPAFVNGVFGHKPTQGIVPNSGQWPHTEGSAAEMLTAGPLARRAEDLMPLMRLISGPDGIDPQTRAVELGDPASVSLEGLEVSLLHGASFFPASREMRNSCERVAGALQARGAKLRELDFGDLKRALYHFLVALGNGGGESLLELLTPAGGPPATVRGVLRGRGSLHTWPTIWLTLGEALLERLPETGVERTLAAKRALADEFNATLGDGVALYPSHSRVAPRHDSTVKRPWAIQPTVLFNVTNSPVTQVPIGLNSERLPLGVQVVAAHGKDHIPIAVALELERAFGGWQPPFAAR